MMSAFTVSGRLDRQKIVENKVGFRPQPVVRLVGCDAKLLTDKFAQILELPLTTSYSRESNFVAIGLQRDLQSFQLDQDWLRDSKAPALSPSVVFNDSVQLLLKDLQKVDCRIHRKDILRSDAHQFTKAVFKDLEVGYLALRYDSETNGCCGSLADYFA